MNKRQLLSLVGTYGSPVLVIFCGLVLVFSPDSASILVSRILSTVLLLWGIGSLLGAVFSGDGRMKQVMTAAVTLITSRWLSDNPLGLAAGISRILGICLLLGAAGTFFASRTSGGKALALVECVLGIVLICLPLFASRLVFTVCGLVVTMAGVGMLAGVFRKGRTSGSGKPPIIDAL